MKLHANYGAEPKVGKFRMVKIAFVDLTAPSVAIEEADPALLEEFLGGRGLGAKLLFDRVGPDIQPLSPDNLLIFAIGPFTGTPWPTGSRYHVTFRSPLTGIYGYANAGGFWGAALRRVGYGALVISGRAPSPVYLDVSSEAISIRAADHLWGRDTETTHDALATEGRRVLCIGPAGENCVRFAAIINDRGRAAARCGGGAVMGSKRLKAIAVRGGEKPHLPSAFLDLVRQANRRMRDHPAVAALRRWGTVWMVEPKNRIGDLPARNHQVGQVPWVERVDAEAINRYVIRNKGCFACPIRCGRISQVEHGPYACETEGPEYETLDALGPMCWIDDPQIIIYANHLCNRLGLDTISTGVTIAFAMECHQHGLLDDSEFSLDWGDANTVLSLIERIAHRRGLGDLLAEGVRRAGEEIEAEEFAMHVKGMELPRQEPRIAKGFGLGHAVSNRGADHMYALPTVDRIGDQDLARRLFPPEIVSELMEIDDETYKPDLVVFSENYCALSDALGVCKFSTAETYALFPEDLAEGLSALWGQSFNADELLTVGERIVNLERLYNVRLGLSRADDQLPHRFTEEPLDVWDFTLDSETGAVLRSDTPVTAGALIRLQPMLDRYYALRGWDANGIPTQETLERLGLNGLN